MWRPQEVLLSGLKHLNQSPLIIEGNNQRVSEHDYNIICVWVCVTMVATNRMDRFKEILHTRPWAQNVGQVPIHNGPNRFNRFKWWPLKIFKKLYGLNGLLFIKNQLHETKADKKYTT